MGKLLKDWLTESDGTSYCPWNFLGILAIGIMSYKVAAIDVKDPATLGSLLQSFGAAIMLIIGGIAGKRWSEHSESRPNG